MDQFRIYHFISKTKNLGPGGEFVVISGEPKDDVVKEYIEEDDGEWEMTTRDVDGDCSGMPCDRILRPE